MAPPLAMARQMLKTSCAKASFAQAEDFIKKCQIENDYFDITNVKYAVPTYWDIAKVYKHLIISVSQDNPKQYIKTLITVYNSWIADKIDD